MPDSLKKEENALAKLKSEGKIKEEDYQRQLFELRENYERQLDNLDSYVDRFSRIDLSELSAAEQDIIELVQQGKMDEAIAKYEQQNYVSQYAEEVAQVREISSAIDRLTSVKSSKEQTRDSLLAAIDRQIKTLELAGGKDNFDKIGVILHDIVHADTSNIDLRLRYVEFCNRQNMLDNALSNLQGINFQQASDLQKFKISLLTGAIKQKTKI